MMKAIMLKWILYVVMTLFFVLLTSEGMQAQAPPMLPGSPEQAPVTGGLALLAASGGAYAWMKLRRSRNP
jgi:hypothetical protein